MEGGSSVVVYFNACVWQIHGVLLFDYMDTSWKLGEVTYVVCILEWPYSRLDKYTKVICTAPGVQGLTDSKLHWKGKGIEYRLMRCGVWTGYARLGMFTGGEFVSRCLQVKLAGVRTISRTWQQHIQLGLLIIHSYTLSVLYVNNECANYGTQGRGILDRTRHIEWVYLYRYHTISTLKFLERLK